MTDRIACVSCRREIDAAARLCPYCGADPRTGEKVDTQALIEQEFHPRKMSPSESVLDYARRRQGIIVTLGLFAALLILSALHQFVSRRNERNVSTTPAVPLTEITDLSSPGDESRQQPMPQLRFEYEGHAQTMRTYIVEAGAIPPPEAAAPPQQPQPPQPR